MKKRTKKKLERIAKLVSLAINVATLIATIYNLIKLLTSGE